MLKREFCSRWSRLSSLGMLGLALCATGAKVNAQEIPTTSLGRSLPADHLGVTLLSELNCVACHSVDGELATTLNSKQAPRLGRAGVPLTPQFLSDYLMDPHGVGQGRTMPDVLHALDREKKASVVDELVHFLISEQGVKEETSVGLDEFKLEKGRQLFHSVGCVACHAPQESLEELATGDIKAPDFTGAQGDRFAGDTVPIGDLSRKVSVTDLAAFLQDPLKTRPSGRMPSLGLSGDEAVAIAMYLLRGQATALFDPNQELKKTRGLKYTYLESSTDPALPTDGNEDFLEHFPGRLSDLFGGQASRAKDLIRVVKTGIADTPSLDLRNGRVPEGFRRERVGFVFSGSVRIDLPGEYTFYLGSDDGSRLYIGSDLLVANDGNHGMGEKSGKIRLTPGDHPLKLTFYNNGADGGLALGFSGPGIDGKQLIPSDRFSYLGQPLLPLGGSEFALNAAKVNAGRKHFQNYGCVQCHSLETEGGPAKAAGNSLLSLAATSEGACWSANPSPKASRYFLREQERQALRQVLADRKALTSTKSNAWKLDHQLTQFNCQACHERDGRGGPSVARAEYFGMTTEADLGDEGRLPPHLEKVGAKLRPDWISEVLLKRGAVRPYMATRMPQFGEANVGHLPGWFEAVDDPNPDDSTTEVPLMDTKYGRRLLGTKGLSCVQCHTYGPYPSLGTPAIDLTQMSHRLKRSWFREYLLDPASLRPGTRMPPFFPDGESVNEEIFDGNAERQIQALWGFLEIADDTNPPDGLVQGKKEIMAENEAVIYRNFIEGAGARAIGVGYPEKGNLAFDAQQVRLAMIWQGPFMDASRHSTGRGQGYEPPLGHNIVRLPDGPPLAFLPDRSVPWPETVGKEGGFEFKGYRLDEKRRPAFRYQFRGVSVEDFPIAIETELDAKLVRRMQFRSRANVANLWMRLATGDSIRDEGNGRFFVDSRMRLTIQSTGAQPALVRESGGRQELLVPVQFVDGSGTVEVEMVW